MIVRITLEEVEEIGGDHPIQLGSPLNGRHMIIEGEYDRCDPDDILSKIELQINEWEEEVAKEEHYEVVNGKLARIVGMLLIEIPSMYHPEIDQIEYDAATETAKFAIGSPDGAAQVNIHLT